MKDKENWDISASKAWGNPNWNLCGCSVNLGAKVLVMSRSGSSLGIRTQVCSFILAGTSRSTQSMITGHIGFRCWWGVSCFAGRSVHIAPAKKLVVIIVPIRLAACRLLSRVYSLNYEQQYTRSHSRFGVLRFLTIYFGVYCIMLASITSVLPCTVSMMVKRWWCVHGEVV